MGMVSDTWHVSVTCRHVIYTWFCNFWTHWATDKYEGSKWGRISPGIQWAWSQTPGICLSHIWCTFSFWYGTVFYIYENFVSSDPFELQTSVRGQNALEFHWESDGHGCRQMTWYGTVFYIYENFNSGSRWLYILDPPQASSKWHCWEWSNSSFWPLLW